MAFDPFALMDEQPESGKTTVTLLPTLQGPSDSPTAWTEGDVIAFFQDLGLGKYAESLKRHKVDGMTLLDLLSVDEGAMGLAELGLTSPQDLDTLRGAASHLRTSAPSLGQPHSGPRVMAGPLTPAKPLPKRYAHVDYIGCCGFPCRKGEHSGKLRIPETDDDGDDDDDGARADPPPSEVSL